MKQAQDFKQQALKHEIQSWPIRNCSFCHYQCGYFFSPDLENVVYDTGCDCSWGGEQPRDWEDVAEHYNLQEDSDVIKGMDEFWKFN
jgi:hypothetical protein